MVQLNLVMCGLYFHPTRYGFYLHDDFGDAYSVAGHVEKINYFFDNGH